MLLKVNQPGWASILLLACVAFAISFTISYSWAQRNPASDQSPVVLASLGTDRDQDGLKGPVNRVRTETAKLSIRDGKLVEGGRELLETTTYDARGKRIDNAYFLISGNPQVGREDYAYDERGSMSEMTLRDGGDRILRKEVYAYEYDALGNWVKMLTYEVVYEGGKVAQQPTEVTYRNISYYFDQAIAEIASRNPAPAAGGQSNSQPVADERAALRSAFEGWLAATNARDLERLMSFYGPQLKAFYRSRDVSQELVRADRARMFERAEAIEVSAREPEIELSPDEQTSTIRFFKEYVIKLEGRERRGRVIQQLEWQRSGEGWKIVSERDIKVLGRS
ncbi:MAG TPA: nuclear transport factor 2 family protein [Pyrinomonadaceae bacterium]|jgi:ketosteroid isomerase-like protein